MSSCASRGYAGFLGRSEGLTGRSIWQADGVVRCVPQEARFNLSYRKFILISKFTKKLWLTFDKKSYLEYSSYSVGVLKDLPSDVE